MKFFIQRFTKTARILCFFALAQLIYLPSVQADVVEETRSTADRKAIQFVTVTGRAAIDSPDDTSLARRRALEDALYLASLKGGAKINGFSAISSGTELTDNFVVRPTTKILDYAILREVIKSTHYEVTLNVVIGDLGNKNCANNRIFNLVTYKPSLSLTPSTPAWLEPVLTDLYKSLIKEIASRENVEIIGASSTDLEPQVLMMTNDLYDYTSLTTGRVRTALGSYAYVPEIIMSIENKSGTVNTETILLTEINSNLLDGFTYKKVMSKSHKISLKLRNNSPWKMVNVLSKPSKTLIIETLLKSVKKHVESLFAEFDCQALRASLNFDEKQNAMMVKLGKKHGLSLTSLAYTKGTNTPFVLFKVENLTDDSSVLKPLDPRRSLKPFAGQIVEFLETL